MPRPSELLVQMMVELAAGKRADSLRELGRWLDTLSGQTDPVTQTIVGGGGAPINASYVTINNTSDLTRERALAVADPINLTDGGANGSVTIGIDADAFDGRYLLLDASNDPVTGALDIKTDHASAFRVLTAGGAVVTSVDTVNKIATIKGTQRLTAVASTESLDRTVTSESGGAGVAENIVSTVNNTYPVLRYGPTGTPPYVGSSFEFLAADNAHRLLFVSQADGFGVPTYNVISSDYNPGGGSVVPLVFRVGGADWSTLPNLLTLTNANARLDGRLEVYGSSAVVDIIAPDTAGIYSVLHLYDSGNQGWAITKNPVTRDFWINKDTSYGGYALTALAIEHTSGRMIIGPNVTPIFNANAQDILHASGAQYTAITADGTTHGQFQLAANGVNQWSTYSQADTVYRWYRQTGGTPGDVMTLTAAGALATIGTVQGTQLISTIATGTSPLSVTSATLVTNLNADLLDGKHASDFALAGAYLTSVTVDSPLTGAGTAASHLSLPAATSLVDGYLTHTDWATFNGKQAAYTILSTLGALANAAGWLHNDGAGVLAYSTPTKTDVGLGNVENTALSTWAGSTSLTTLGTVATGTWQGSAIADSYIASAATWNAKQPAGNYITALTGDVTAAGPGSAAATLATVNSNVGSFTNASITVNAKGLITAASSGATPVTGSGTTNYIAKFTGSNAIGDSLIRDDGTGLGIGTVPIAASLIDVRPSTTITSGTYNGLNVVYSANPSGSSTGVYQGLTFVSGTQSGNAQTITGSVRGVVGQAQHNGTGTLTTLTAMEVATQINSSGNVGTARGLKVFGVVGSTGRATTNYGIEIDTNYATTTVNTSLGIAASSAAGNLKYGISIGAISGGSGANVAIETLGGQLQFTHNANSTLATLTGHSTFTAATPLMLLTRNDANTNVVVTSLTLRANTTGTAAAGFGLKTVYELESSTTASQTAGYDERLWTDATHASRTVLYRGTTTGNATQSGFYGAWSFNAISNTAITIIPNGTGDVASVGTFLFSIKDNTAGTTNGGVVVLNPGGGAISLLSDGTDTLQVTCAADGSLSIARSAGSHTFSVSLWGTWQ